MKNKMLSEYRLDLLLCNLLHCNHLHALIQSFYLYKMENTETMSEDLLKKIKLHLDYFVALEFLTKYIKSKGLVKHSDIPFSSKHLVSQNILNKCNDLMGIEFVTHIIEKNE